LSMELASAARAPQLSGWFGGLPTGNLRFASSRRWLPSSTKRPVPLPAWSGKPPSSSQERIRGRGRGRGWGRSSLRTMTPSFIRRPAAATSTVAGAIRARPAADRTGPGQSLAQTRKAVRSACSRQRTSQFGRFSLLRRRLRAGPEKAKLGFWNGVINMWHVGGVQVSHMLRCELLTVARAIRARPAPARTGCGRGLAQARKAVRSAWSRQRTSQLGGFSLLRRRLRAGRRRPRYVFGTHARNTGIYPRMKVQSPNRPGAACTSVSASQLRLSILTHHLRRCSEKVCLCV
jgi:hypothetical protein